MATSVAHAAVKCVDAGVFVVVGACQERVLNEVSVAAVAAVAAVTVVAATAVAACGVRRAEARRLGAERHSDRLALLDGFEPTARRPQQLEPSASARADLVAGAREPVDGVAPLAAHVGPRVGELRDVLGEVHPVARVASRDAVEVVAVALPGEPHRAVLEERCAGQAVGPPDRSEERELLRRWRPGIELLLAVITADELVVEQLRDAPCPVPPSSSSAAPPRVVQQVLVSSAL